MRTQKGFTLLEVLVAVAIMGLIMVLVWSNTSQSLNSKERIEKRDMIYQHGRIALQKFTDDLSMAFLTKKTAASTVAASTTAELLTTSVVTIPRPITFCIGRDEGDRDTVRFTSFAHMRLFSGAKESDQCKISYEVLPSPDEPNVFNLIRREVPWLDANTEVEARPLVVAENIRDFELEYYDTRKDEWGKDWDTEVIDFRERLPLAVRVTLSFPDPDDEEESIVLKTIVLLPLSGGTIDL